MISTNHDQRAIEFAGLFQLLPQQAHIGIVSLHLAQIVGEVLAHLRHIGQELRQLAFEIIRLDAPQLLARTFDPSAMHRRRAEPIQPRLIGLSIFEERVEVAAHLGEDGVARFGYAGSGRHALGQRCEALGVPLTREQLDVMYKRFTEAADRKKGLRNDEIVDIARGVVEELSKAATVK